MGKEKQKPEYEKPGIYALKDTKSLGTCTEGSSNQDYCTTGSVANNCYGGSAP